MKGFSAVISIIPARISLWGEVGPAMFHLIFPWAIVSVILVILVVINSDGSVFDGTFVAVSWTAGLVLLLETIQIIISNRVGENTDIILGPIGIGFGVTVTTFVLNKLLKSVT